MYIIIVFSTNIGVQNKCYDNNCYLPIKYIRYVYILHLLNKILKKYSELLASLIANWKLKRLLDIMFLWKLEDRVDWYVNRNIRCILSAP